MRPELVATGIVCVALAVAIGMTAGEAVCGGRETKLPVCSTAVHCQGGTTRCVHTLDPLSIPLIAAAGFSVIACWRCRPAVPIIFGLLLMALCELLIGTGGWWALLPSAIMVLAGLGLPGAGRYQRGRRVAAAVALAASLGVLALGMARPLFLTWPYVFLPLSIWLVYAAFTRAEERSLARAL